MFSTNEKTTAFAREFRTAIGDTEGHFNGRAQYEFLANFSARLRLLAKNFWLADAPRRPSSEDPLGQVLGAVDVGLEAPDVNVYIPALRTTRGLRRDWEAGNEIAEEVRARYFPWMDGDSLNSTGSSHVLMTGERLYAEIRRKLLGNLRDRDMVAKFQTYLGSTFFGGQSVVLIPKERGADASNSHTLHMKIGSEAERPVHDIGDGISQLLIILLPLFEFSNCNLSLFIEEPELYLHPGLQRRLIDAFINAPDRGGAPYRNGATRQIYVATHSNVFLDLSIEKEDVSFFRTSKSYQNDHTDERLATVEITPLHSPDRPLLNALGIQNSSVLLANCTIWVEGPSDRIYLRHFLKLYTDAHGRDKAPRENVDYVIAEYAGSNLGHWYFDPIVDDPKDDNAHQIWVARLCGIAMVIADKDDTEAEPGSQKAKNLRDLEQQLKHRFLRLDVREIENLLTPDTIKETLLRLKGPKAKASPEFQSFLQADYTNARMGSFIRDKVLKNSSDYTPKFWETKLENEPPEGSSLKRKPEFALATTACMTSYAMLSAEAQRVIGKVVEHVNESRTSHGC